MSTMWILAAMLPALALAAFSPPQVLSPLSGRSSAVHPLVVAGPLVLWCTSDAPIRRAFFSKAGGAKKEGVVRGSNATLLIEAPTVLDAGDYTCELETTRGKTRENGYVYVRPIFQSALPEKLEPREGDEFWLEAQALTAVRGSPVTITCPVYGHPSPKIKWTKDGKSIDLSKTVAVKGADIEITSADFSHEGDYSCEAVNEFTAAAKTSRPMIVVQRKLRVKSELAWLYPLIVIITILVLLLAIIFACEIRKKRQEKLLTGNNDNGDD